MRSEMWQRIRAARRYAKMTQQQLADALNVSKSAVAQWEAKATAQRTMPTSENLKGISTHTGAPIEWIYNDAAPLEARWMLDVLPGGVAEAPSGYYAQSEGLRYVPLISSATAGNWGEVCDSYQPGDGERSVPTTANVGRRAFALRVRGDSMEPRIPDGAIVIVDPATEAHPGRMVVVRQNHDSEATIKTLISDGGQLLLKPENQRYPIMPMRDDAIICGVVRQIVMDVD